MTAQQMLGLGLRLTALWLLVITSQLFSMAMAMQQAFNLDDMSCLKALALTALVPAVVLWFFPMLLAHKLLPAPQAGATAHGHLRSTVAACIVILGISCLLRSVPTFFSLLGLLTIDDTNGSIRAALASINGSVMIACTQFVMGSCLVCMPMACARKIFPPLAPTPPDASGMPPTH